MADDSPPEEPVTQPASLADTEMRPEPPKADSIWSPVSTGSDAGCLFLAAVFVFGGMLLALVFFASLIGSIG